MIDFIRAYFLNKEEVEARFMKLNKKSFIKGVYNFNTKEDEYPLKTDLDNMFVRFTKQTGYIENSLHKKYNIMCGLNNHNHNDFTFCQLQSVLKALEHELGIKLYETHLTQFEFGFNLDLGSNPSKVIDENILMYKYNSACLDPKHSKNKKIKKFIFNNYEIKVYNKSLQYGLKDFGKQNLLRIEVKYKTKKEFNKLGVYSLDDFTKLEVIKNIYNDFISKISDLLIIDSYEGTNCMTEKERDLIIKGTHPNYWIDINNKLHRNTRYKTQKRLKLLISKYNLDTWKVEIFKSLESKFKKLISPNCSDNSIDAKIDKCA